MGGEDRALADPRRPLCELGGATHLQGFELAAPDGQQCGGAGIHELHDGVDERFVITARVNTAAAAKPQGLLKRDLG